MYPDLITPKSYPDKLQEIAYDPFGLMPAALPAHPRVFVSAAKVARAKVLMAECAWTQAGLRLLLDHCAADGEVPETLPEQPDGKANNAALYYAQRHAMAFLLTGEEAHRERGIALFHRLARAYPGWPINRGGGRATSNSLGESHFTHHLGRTYDLLAACGLNDEDDALFRDLVRLSYEVSDHPSHPTCGNHNTWRLCGRLAAAAALGDLQGIHDVLYGYERDGVWRYGLVHQWRHDILPDGLHWERTPGYHYYTLMGFTEIADMFANLGVDIWHAELPLQRQRDGDDIHRVYGPRGVKSLKVAYDAPFYLMSPTRHLSLLSDTGLDNLRGVHIWGPVYELAYEAYGDDKYAWLLDCIEREHPEREQADLPMSLQTVHGDLDCFRLREASYPAGAFSLAGDTRFAPLARHEQSSTLFPCFGGAMLRSDPADVDAPSAYIFYGPHNAGHQSPAALHVDIFAREPVTSAPDAGGYDDPNYLTWIRTTIAHNTVTVDESPMFPYDFPTESIWECDQWRDTVSDGELRLFQPGADFSAVRASNDNVYPGIFLDRTLVVTKAYVLDVYRVLGEAEHQYDWAMHVVGAPDAPDTTPLDLGTNRGYRHMNNARRLPDGTTTVPWPHCTARLASPAGAQLLLADDLNEKHKRYGALTPVAGHTALIVRTRAKNALFVSLWQIGPGTPPDLHVQGAADTDLQITAGPTQWTLPYGDGAVKKI